MCAEVRGLLVDSFCAWTNRACSQELKDAQRRSAVFLIRNLIIGLQQRVYAVACVRCRSRPHRRGLCTAIHLALWCWQACEIACAFIPPKDKTPSQTTDSTLHTVAAGFTPTRHGACSKLGVQVRTPTVHDSAVSAAQLLWTLACAGSSRVATSGMDGHCLAPRRSACYSSPPGTPEDRCPHPAVS